MKSIGKLLEHFKRDTIDLQQFRADVQHCETHIADTFKNGETLLHRLVASPLAESLKLKCIYVLCDAGVDVNAQSARNRYTCLHLAAMRALPDVTRCILQNGADLTITDHVGLCAYNYAKRLEDKAASASIVANMQVFYPTYWMGVEKKDMSIVRRLVNSWCKFKVRKEGKSLVEYARERDFRQALELFASLEHQMDLCFAVLACNVAKCDRFVKNHHGSLKMNFRNMKEKGATVLFYAIREKNLDLLKTLCQTKTNMILSQCILDDADIDYPVYFAVLNSAMDRACLEYLTPPARSLDGNGNDNGSTNCCNSKLDISHLFYKGMTFLRYGIEIGLDVESLELLMSSKYCSLDLITVKDPHYLTCRQVALKRGQYEYVSLIDKMTVDYITNERSIRRQMALNGFDFADASLLTPTSGHDLFTYAAKSEEENGGTRSELAVFLELVDEYQSRIEHFHKAVETNDYHAVKSRYLIDDMTVDTSLPFAIGDLFTLNLIHSKRKNESQTVLFKAVLNSNYEILKLLLMLLDEDPAMANIYSENIRDHCYRTPMHYAYGSETSKRIAQLLSQFGFSENVFDKDGMTPLDFSERAKSDELQELIAMHKSRSFVAGGAVEPNPWTWQVWTRIQSEKNTFKQLIAVSHQHHHHRGACVGANHLHRHDHKVNFQHAHAPPHTNGCSAHKDHQTAAAGHDPATNIDYTNFGCNLN